MPQGLDEKWAPPYNNVKPHERGCNRQAAGIRFGLARLIRFDSDPRLSRFLLPVKIQC